jgi:hypothetical protein
LGERLSLLIEGDARRTLWSLSAMTVEDEEERAMSEEDLIVEDAARVVVNTVMNAVHLRYIANFGVSLGRCRSLVAWWFVSV